MTFDQIYSSSLPSKLYTLQPEIQVRNVTGLPSSLQLFPGFAHHCCINCYLASALSRKHSPKALTSVSGTVCLSGPPVRMPETAPTTAGHHCPTHPDSGLGRIGSRSISAKNQVFPIHSRPIQCKDPSRLQLFIIRLLSTAWGPPLSTRKTPAPDSCI